MDTIYAQISYYCWPALFVVWLLGYFRLKKTVKRPSAGKYLATSFLIALGFGFLFSRHISGILGVSLTPQNSVLGIIGAALAIIGVLFAIWARVTIGSNWSGSVATVKQEHQLVQSGPYAIVRHPIYTGFFFAMIGTALTVGLAGNYLGVAIGLIAFLIRIKLEEKIMTAEFPDAYPIFKQKTKGLIPFVW